VGVSAGSGNFNAVWTIAAVSALSALGGKSTSMDVILDSI
jgi:hypothetical protein